MNNGARSSPLRALIVDDEPMVRALITASLTKEHFVCDTASNGLEAWNRIQSGQTKYHLVVTDLAMPGLNGHALALNLLTLPDRPVIAILTGVMEPRIAKDLIGRGVDDIVFKPVQFAPFAAKMRSLTDRRLQQASLAASPQPTNSPSPARSYDLLPRVTAEELRSRLRGLTQIPSISQAAVEVFRLTSNPDFNFQQVAAAVQREPALITDVLRLANSTFYNPTARKIVDVDQAVARLGQVRVGEMALSSAAFAAVSQQKILFFSLDKVWRKCLAGGICLEMLVDQIGYARNVDGLFCATLLQPMGRIMLASLFPEIYERMLKQCERDRESLSQWEDRVFPQSIGEITASILASWNIPEEIHQPLRYVSQTFQSLAATDELPRPQVELIKTAVLLGELAVDELDPWEQIDVPSGSMLKRLKLHSLDELIRQCREDLHALTMFGRELRTTTQHSAAAPPTSVTAYKRLRHDSLDLMPQIFAAAGVRLVNLDDSETFPGPVVVNALDASPAQITSRLSGSATRETILLVDAEHRDQAATHGRTLRFPCSVAALNDLCTKTIRPAAAPAEQPAVC